MSEQPKCRKVRYISRASAKEAIKRKNRSHELDKKLTVAYLCTECKYWHVTSQPKVSKINFLKQRNKKLNA